MKFVLSINCNNENFKPDPIPEVVRILGNVAHRLSDGDKAEFYRDLHDADGKIVGQFKMIREDSDRK